MPGKNGLEFIKEHKKKLATLGRYWYNTSIGITQHKKQVDFKTQKNTQSRDPSQDIRQYMVSGCSTEEEDHTKNTKKKIAKEDHKNTKKEDSKKKITQ